MKEWWRDTKENVRTFSQAYGRVTFLCLCGLVSALLLSLIFSSALPRPLKVSFLDIGQGDSILIETPSGHTMIIDGGPSDVVLARLNEQMNYFTRDIDVMISTHPDADHVTGLIPVMEKYRVKNIIVSGEKSETGVFADLNDHTQKEGADIRVGYRGDVIDFQDGVSATILHPYSGEGFSDTNSASVSLVLTYGEESFLLTGDLPTIKESILLSSQALPKNITVYKAGHHGSRSSSGEQLLTYIKPEYAIISAGKDNKYGHPNSEALERLQKYSKEILSTIDHGTISFLTDGKTIDIETQK